MNEARSTVSNKQRSCYFVRDILKFEKNDIPRDGEQRLRSDGLGTLPVRIELVELDEKRLMVVKLVRAFGGCLGTKRR